MGTNTQWIVHEMNDVVYPGIELKVNKLSQQEAFNIVKLGGERYAMYGCAWNQPVPANDPTGLLGRCADEVFAILLDKRTEAFRQDGRLTPEMFPREYIPCVRLSTVSGSEQDTIPTDYHPPADHDRIFDFHRAQPHCGCPLLSENEGRKLRHRSAAHGSIHMDSHPS